MNKKNRFPRGTRGLAAYELAMQVAENTLKMLDNLHAPGDLNSQTRRAVISIPLNVAEGAGRRGKDRSYHFSIAYASGQEVMAALELIRRLNLVDQSEIDTLIRLMDRVNALVYGLMR